MSDDLGRAQDDERAAQDAEIASGWSLLRAQAKERATRNARLVAQRRKKEDTWHNRGEGKKIL